MNLLRQFTDFSRSTRLLLAVIFLLPFEHLPTFEFHGYTIKLSYLAAVLCLLSLIIDRPLTYLRNNPVTLPEKALLALLLFAAMLDATIAPDRIRGGIFVLLWAFVFVMYGVTSRLLAAPKARLFAENLLLVVTAAVCIFGIYQYLGDSYGLSAQETGLRIQYTKLVFGFPRIESVAIEPLYFSNYLLVPFFLTLSRYLISRNWKPYFWLLVLIATNIVLGISRGAYLAAGIGLLLLALFLILHREVKFDRRKIGGVLVALLLAVTLSVFGIYGINGRKATTNFVKHAAVSDAKTEASVQDRFANDKTAWKMFLSRPLTGYGPASFGILYSGDQSQIRDLGYTIVNNEYLELLSETGIFGFGCFLFFLVSLAIQYRRGFNHLDATGRLTSFCYLCGIIGILFQYNFFSTLYILYIWVFFGMFSSFSSTAPVIVNKK